MTKYNVEALQTAMKSRANVVYINNTAANGALYHIPPYVNLVIVTNSASYTQSLRLPSVAESVGLTLTIMFPDFGGGGTVSDNDDSLSDWSDLTNNADNEYCVLFNDGRGWKVLVTDM